MIERILSRAQTRVIVSMLRERDYIAQQANAQIDEIGAAISEQAEVLRQHFGLPDGKYDFFGNPDEMMLRRMPEEGEAGPDPGPDGDDVDPDVPVSDDADPGAMERDEEKPPSVLPIG